MIVLGIEGARVPAGVSLLQVDEGKGSVSVGALALVEKSQSLSGALLHAIEAVLEQSGATLDDVGALCVGVGPGSWTGLRVTLSLAKTLAQAREIQLAGVPSFDAIAQAAWHAIEPEESDESEKSQEGSTHRLLLVVGECRPGELYAKVFEASDEYLAPAQDEWIARPEEILDAVWTQALSRGIESPPLVVCAEGDSALEVMRAACEEKGEEALFAPVDAAASALEVALAGLQKLAEGEADDPLVLVPLYLAPSSAERVRFGL